MRRLTQIFDDNSTGDWWVNPDHVVEVRPHGNNPTINRSYVVTLRNTTPVLGWARDVALELNGHFDE